MMRRNAALCAFACALLWCGAARAQPASVEELQAAIAAAPDAPTVGARLTELAELQLAALSLDGADTAALFGVPTQEQEERVRRVATAALESARRAAEKLDQAAARLLEHPNYEDDPELQNLRSELAVQYRLIRVPLAQARGAALLASVEKDRGARERFSREATAALALMERGSEALDARRLALLAAVNRFNALGAEHQERLMALAAPEALRRLRALSAHTARELILAAAMSRGATTDASALLHERFGIVERDALDGVAMRDALALIAIVSRGDAQSGVTMLASGDARTNESLAELALSKIERLVTPDTAASQTTPIGRIAVGRLALQSGRVDHAIEALRSAWAELREERSVFARVAGWTLARALRERNGGVSDIAEAGDVLLTISNRPDEPRADDALATAIGLLEWARRAHGRGGAIHDELSQKLKEALRRALSERPHAPAADHWRLSLANLSEGIARRELLESIKSGGGAFVRARLALAWLAYEDVLKAPSDAQREAAAFTMRQLVEQALNAADAPDDALAAALAQASAAAKAEGRRFDEAAADALAWDDAGGDGAPDVVDLVRRRASAALREAIFVRDAQYASDVAPAVRAASERMFRRIERARAPRTLVDSCAIDLADAMNAMGLANEIDEAMAPWREAFGVTRGVGVATAMGLAASGEMPEAFATLREVVNASRVLEVTDDLHWRAWAGMLEILQEQNTDGARSDAITRQIARLRLEDEALGGQLTKRRIEQVERAARSRMR